jgi:hypothetical protein
LCRLRLGLFPLLPRIPWFLKLAQEHFLPGRADQPQSVDPRELSGVVEQIVLVTGNVWQSQPADIVERRA